MLVLFLFSASVWLLCGASRRCVRHTLSIIRVRVRMLLCARSHAGGNANYTWWWAPCADLAKFSLTPDPPVRLAAGAVWRREVPAATCYDASARSAPGPPSARPSTIHQGEWTRSAPNRLEG